MKTPHKPLYWLMALLLTAGSFACEQERTSEGDETITVTEDNDQDTALVATTGETTEDKLEKLRSWMNEKADRADTAIRDNWPETREEIRRINQDIERNFDSLSTKSKEEYRQLQNRYERWEARQERRQQQPLDEELVSQWQDQLLREYKDLQTIKPANIREAYLTFMGTVRAKNRNWSQEDWDYVDYVYRSLNDRRGQIEGQMSTADKLKIRALQAEYLTLEGAADTRSIVRDTDGN